MKVLLIGADTPLGHDLEEFLRHWHRHEIETVSFAAGRWKSERRAKKAVLRSRPDVVLDARIQGAVDSGEPLLEQDVERCEWLAKAARRCDAIYFLLSSALVFAGLQERPYVETLDGDGEDILADMLQRSEQIVRNRCDRHLILRLGPVFSSQGANFLTSTLDRLLSGETLVLDRGTRSCPVSSLDGARVIGGMLDQVGTGAKSWGNYHYCSSDITNGYEFAEVLLACASQFREFEQLEVTLEEQPADGVLTRRLACERLLNTFAIKQVPWRGFVTAAVRRYFEERRASTAA